MSAKYVLFFNIIKLFNVFGYEKGNKKNDLGRQQIQFIPYLSGKRE